MEHTIQTIVTIGPASSSRDVIEGLIDAGMSSARINFSHGTHETNGAAIDLVRSVAAERGVRIPIIQDLSGPRVQMVGEHHFDALKAEITSKDLEDLDFGIQKSVEYIAQSYVGGAQDVELLRAEIERRGGSARIIAKVERAEALASLESIARVADVIMIARGDLAEAIPLEDLPFAERDAIAICNRLGKPVIVATGLLLSMVEAATPARSEVVDIAFAILSGADALMLSDETARGKHPLEALEALQREITRATGESSTHNHHPITL